VDCVAQDQRTTRAPVTISGARPGRRPVVVQTLIAVNVLIFAITAYQARGVMNLEPSTLFRDWALFPLATRNGYWWQLVTAGFLHVNPIHILMNMFALWVIGRDMERILGPARFTAVYLVGLLGGSVSVLLFGQVDSQTVGASGAVFALMGGLLVLVYRLKVNPGQVIGMIAINLVISVAIPGISLLGHVGGLVTGALLTAALIYLPAQRRRLWQVGAVVVLVVVLIGLVLVRFAQIPQLT
jgi:membrane associated rhomboid family serine protease